MRDYYAYIYDSLSAACWLLAGQHEGDDGGAIPTSECRRREGTDKISPVVSWATKITPALGFLDDPFRERERDMHTISEPIHRK